MRQANPESDPPVPAAAQSAPGAGPVAVVRLIVGDAQGRVLLVRRAGGHHARGRWCLPGGKVDYSETVAEAVARELREETALECTAARFLFYQDSLPMAAGAMHCINLYFACTVTGQLLLNEESSECAWVGPDELQAYRLVFRNDEGLDRYWKGTSNQAQRCAPPAES